MRYKLLKKANINISEVSFGCMSLKGDTTNNKELVGKAIDNGINLFDTADLYDKGENERLLGSALKGRRNDIFISTKVGNKWRKDGSGWDWTPRKEYILSAVDESLKRLQADYIDLYLLHGGTTDDPIDEVIEAFERLVDMGKIKHYGLSSIRPNVIKEYVRRSDIAVVMTQYSLLDRRPEEETLSLLHDNNIGIMARGTVAGGLLSGKEPSNYLGMDTDKVAAIIESLKIGVPVGMPLNSAAMRYVIDNPAVTSAVVGIRKDEHLNDAIAATKHDPLSSESMDKLKKSWQGNIYKEHR